MPCSGVSAAGGFVGAVPKSGRVRLAPNSRGKCSAPIGKPGTVPKIAWPQRLLALRGGSRGGGGTRRKAPAIQVPLGKPLGELSGGGGISDRSSGRRIGEVAGGSRSGAGSSAVGVGGATTAFGNSRPGGPKSPSGPAAEDLQVKEAVVGVLLGL